jgi:predicted NBD/HSP70 family sugar kinase
MAPFAAARQRATVRDLRRVNRAAVLRQLFLAGPLNRVDLARLTGLSSGSVTNVTAALLEERQIVEVGLEESDGGRPRVLLDVNPEFGAVIGVDVGETGIRIEGFDLQMREVGGVAVRVHPQHHPAEVVVDQIIDAIAELKERLLAQGRRVLGAGIAVPGIVEHDGEARVHAPNIGWSEIPLERLVRERVGLPVLADNGAKTLGQAEMWRGAGRGAQDVVVTLWGTGVGAAIFTDGRPYRGATSSAGEWGHASVVVGGERCRCGAEGCLEAYIGAAALLRQWRETDPRAPLPQDPDAEDWVDQLLAEAPANQAAAEVLDRAATYFGVAAANLANLFNPQRIVVGGWLGIKLGPRLLPAIREVVDRQALEYPARSVTVELGQLGPDAVALGASTLVVEQLLARGGEPLRLQG